MSATISKKLKFKGDKPKKKKRSHAHARDEGGEGVDDLAQGDPSGWVFPEHTAEISGPAFIVLPTEPLTCLAWHPQAQKVYAAPLDLPQAPEGHAELSRAEVLAAIEPTDVNHVWVASRLSGNEGVMSLRSSTGTFLTAHPSGSLSATTPSRGPLEALLPTIHLPGDASDPSDGGPSVPFPSITLQSQSQHYLIATSAPGPAGAGAGAKPELRADADAAGSEGRWFVKCQREAVGRVRADRAEESGEGVARLKRKGEGGEGSVGDELRRSKEAQAWGGGRVHLSDKDRGELKRAKKEGRLAEAMLDRRAALKSDRYTK